jgi:hypothetical protein
MDEADLIPGEVVAQLFGTASLQPHRQSATTYDAKVAAFGGEEAVLESVSRGRGLNELALQLGVSVMYFAAWVQHNVSSERMAAACNLGAETLLYKAEVLMSVPHETATMAKQATNLAAHYTRMAERIDPARWAPQRAADAQIMGVTLNMNFGGGGAAAPQVVDVTAQPVETAHDALFQKIIGGETP